MTTNARTSPPAGLQVTRKSLIVIAAILLAAGGIWALWEHMMDPNRPWVARWQVTRYLKKNSNTSSFQVPFPFPSKAAMAKAPASGGTAGGAMLKGKRTGKDFDTLAREYLELRTALLPLEYDIPQAEQELKTLKPRVEQLAKQQAEARTASATNSNGRMFGLRNLQRRVAMLETTIATRTNLEPRQAALAPMLSDLWDFQRSWEGEVLANDVTDTNSLAGAQAALVAQARQRLRDAKSYTAMYKVIGQELWVADRLLESKNPQHRRTGVSLAMEATLEAIRDAENGWVASRIIAGYLWPNLDLATDVNRRSAFNLDTLLEECANILRQADDFDGLVRNYQMMLAHAGTPQRRDQAHAQMSMAYEQAGYFQEAIGALRQIKATNDFRWALNRIPRIERQMKFSAPNR
jgi:hypothetical protein